MNKLTSRDNIFNNHEPYQVKHNGFDLTHKVISSWDMGKLYPVSIKEVYPNDSFKTQIQWKMILESLQKPIYQNISIKFREYETPYRILWKHWRNYYTGGRRGDYVTQEPKVNLNCASNIKNSLFDLPCCFFMQYCLRCYDIGGFCFNYENKKMITRLYNHILLYFFQDYNPLLKILNPCLTAARLRTNACDQY